MKSLSRFLTVLFSCALALLVSCAGENNGTPDAIDYTADDTSVDDTIIPTDVPDRPDVPDTTETPPPDGDVPVEVPPDVPVEARDDGGCTGATGDACTSAAQCGCVPSTAKQCLQTMSGYVTFPGGYCSAQCTSAADCGPNANCVTIQTAHYCLKTCTSTSQCRMAEGYQCTTIGTDARTYCIPPINPVDSPG